MSDIHLGLPYTSSSGGQVDHSAGLAQDIGNLYLSSEYSDVMLVVAGQKFYAHRVILAARSNYFRAMMFGGLQESHQDEVEIKDANLTAFKVLLKYIYKGFIALHSEKEETVLEILALSHQYGFEELEGSVCDYLKDTLSVSNFCLIYDLTLLYCLSDLRAVCEDFLDKNATQIVRHATFRMLSPPALKSIIERDSFCAPEVEIFSGVKEWAESNDGVDKTALKEILALIRLPLICLLDLLNVVRPTMLLSPDAILDAIKTKNESRDMELRYRGYLVAEENVATPAKDAVVLTGEMKNNLLDGNTSNYDMDRGFTRHSIDDSPQHILVKLGRPCILNHIRLVLWDKDPRSYSYYIEVSMDQKDWIRVVDHKNFHCRSWQYLYFPVRTVRYIKVVGTHNTVNRVFHLVAMEAYYSKTHVLMHHGLIVPTSNAALVSKSAVVIEGVSRSRNNLLNGDIINYDWDSGYTCHQLGSGSICVQLGQPYWLASLRLLLWDCDDRSYSYGIQSSVNGRDWETVVDKTRDSCQSWQVVQFSPRPVVYFKIVGVFNTANEVFHCVHFECPASNITIPITDKLPGVVNLTLNSFNKLNLNSTGNNTNKNNSTDLTTTADAAADAGADVVAIDGPSTNERDGGGIGAGAGGGHGVGAGDGQGVGAAEGVRGLVLPALSGCDDDVNNVPAPNELLEDNERRSEFDIMAESNRSPGIDSDKRTNSVNSVAAAGEARGEPVLVGAEAAVSNVRSMSNNDMFFVGSVSDGLAKDMQNPLIRESNHDACVETREIPVDMYNSRGDKEDSKHPRGDNIQSKGDNHPAGDAPDYWSLGARPRRSFRTGDQNQAPQLPSFYNNIPGHFSPMHDPAQNTGLFPVGSTLPQPMNNSGMSTPAMSTPPMSRTAHSSPTHSEYSSFTRSSHSSPGSEYSTHSCSRNSRAGSVKSASGFKTDAATSRTETMPATMNLPLPDNEPVLVSSPEDVPPYHRPSSPLLLEPRGSSHNDSNSADADAK
uniref:BTB/POZ domain-containing protein 9-like isoform X2 n=2 Tax=Hirondellea gigas TaxID=1518452 RepID=A0A6A7FRB5_9CRUS